MSVALAICSAFVGTVGVLLASNEIPVIAYAILLAVWAGLVQAHDHHKAWLTSQTRPQPQPPLET
jgi:hypothetical protein